MKQLIVLDLDETLIHATQDIIDNYDFRIQDFYVKKRPHLEKFLHYCNDNFEIGIWTSSTENYAQAIIENILPEIITPIFIWSRERCTIDTNKDTEEREYIKDLKKVKKLGFSLDNIVAVDDSPEKLKRQYGNLIRIKPFYDDLNDQELHKLTLFLPNILNTKDIRKLEKRNWRNKVIK
jgi:carboxy-terminal domain RNA polymerase II polypeptide A small phosphatase